MEILQAQGLTKSFGKNLVLDNLDFDLNRGEITALVGRNGSGKTTLLKVLASIFEADEGQVLLDGRDIKKEPGLKRNLAFLPDRFDYFKFDTAKKAMAYYRAIYPDFDQDFFKKELEVHKIPMNKTIRSLSKGQSGLLGLIMVLATKAPFLLLDEVLDGMDVLNKKAILRYLIDASGDRRALVVASHQLQDLEGIAHRILYLNLTGQMEDIKGGRETSISKYQLVVKSDLPEEILDGAILRFNLGRVYTILVDGSSRDWEALFREAGVVQYDALPVQLEDLFYWERGREEKDEELS